MAFPFSFGDFGKSFLKSDILSIDIGFTNIKIVHSRKKNKDSIKVINFGIGGTPSGCIKNGIISNLEGISENLKKMIVEHKISEKNVKIVISAGSSIISKIIYCSCSDNRSVEEKIREEISNNIPVKVNEQKIFYRITGEIERDGAKYQRVLITVVPNTTIENYVKLTTLMNFRPLAIEIPFSSVAKFFSKGFVLSHKEGQLIKSPVGEDGKGSTAVIDLGSETTNLSILCKNALEFNRIILSGGRSLDELIGNRLGVKREIAERYKKMHGIVAERHLGDEIEHIVDSTTREYIGEILSNAKRSIDFYVERCGGQQVEKIVFIGGGSGLKGLNRFAKDVLGKPVYTVENLEFENLEFESNLDKDKVRFLINALGLAM